MVLKGMGLRRLSVTGSDTGRDKAWRPEGSDNEIVGPDVWAVTMVTTIVELGKRPAL